MPRALPAAALLMVVLAGCADSDPGPASAARGSDESRRPEFAPVEYEWRPQILLNTTYTYPRFGMGSQGGWSFNVSSPSRAMMVEWQSFVSCPAGVSFNARFYLTDPNGATTERSLPHGSGTANQWTCLPGTGASVVLSLPMEAKPGRWELRTLGECMCDARFLARAEARFEVPGAA